MEDEAVVVRVGKNGITPSLIEEIKSVLKKRKLVKVKMLKTSLEDGNKHEMAEQLKKSCKARKADMIGHIVTLEL